MSAENNTLTNKVLPVTAALLSLVLFAVSANVLPAILLRAAEGFRVEAGFLANASSIQFTAFILATSLGGIVSDRFGRKKVFLAACCFVIIGSMLWIISGSIAVAFTGSFVLGAGGGILEGMSSALLSDLFPKKRKLVLNVSQIAYCLGAVSGPFVIGLLLPSGVSWRWFFAALGALCVVLFVFYLISRIPNTDHSLETINIRIVHELTMKWTFILPCVVIFLYVFAETVSALYMNYFLQTSLGAPENWAIYSMSIFWLCMGAGRFLCALVPEDYSYSKQIFILTFISGVFLFAQIFMESWVMSIIFFALLGFTFSGIWPLIVGMAASRNPGYTGTVVGITIAAGAVACVVAPPVISSLMVYIKPGQAVGLSSLTLFMACAMLLYDNYRRRSKA